MRDNAHHSATSLPPVPSNSHPHIGLHPKAAHAPHAAPHSRSLDGDPPATPASAPPQVAPPTPALPQDLGAIERAISRAQDVLWHSQNESGGWSGVSDFGSWSTAQIVLCLNYAGQLKPADAVAAAEYLRAAQHPDGAFAPYPGARWTEVLKPTDATARYILMLTVCATVAGWGALRVIGRPEDAQACARAKQFLDDRNAKELILKALDKGEFPLTAQLAALFLAMLGELDLRHVPDWPLVLSTIPPIEWALEHTAGKTLALGLLQMTVLVRTLRGDFAHKGIGLSLPLLGHNERLHCIELTGQQLNPNGSLNDNTWQTAVTLAALHAAGAPSDHPLVLRTVAYLQSKKTPVAENQIFWPAFDGPVWNTAVATRALVRSGVRRQDPRMIKAVKWLASSQFLIANKPKGEDTLGLAQGGWAFQDTNPLFPDCDDTGLALATLGLMNERAPDDALPVELASQVSQSIERATRWLQAMQNADGGWAAFLHSMPGAQPGAMPPPHMAVLSSNPVALVQSLLHPPGQLTDPSTADVAGRVLCGLGACGYTIESPLVAKALMFLAEQLGGQPVWWGRWMVNYLPTTAYILMGLAAVGGDLQTDIVRHATSWILSRQNADGGWGEDPETYLEPSLAGRGRGSMAPLTGLVLTGLIHAGLSSSPAVAAGIRYLLAEQRADGTWPDGGWLHANVPPDSYYSYPFMSRCYPLEALGCYLQVVRAGAQAVSGNGEDASSVARVSSIASERPQVQGTPWTDAVLDAARGRGDPLADSLVAELFASGEVGVVRNMLGAIEKSDEPLPPGLPSHVVSYFKENAVLPSWADRAQIAVGQKLFTRAGWAVAAGLFASSLPQAYASAKGAAVLMYTAGMTDHVSQRVYETAQFLFDTLDEGALGSGGRGIPAAQKVRLMHAAVRMMILRRADWNTDLGVPINQEDLAGTLMTFSCVSIASLRRLKIAVSSEEAEAWQHTWRVIGHFLGVDPQLVPHSFTDAELLMDAIRRRQWAPSPHGRELTAALVRMLQGFTAGIVLRGLPATMIRFLAGDLCADILGLPAANEVLVLQQAQRMLSGISGDPEFLLCQLMQQASHLAMQALVTVERGGKNAKFRIPPALLRSWAHD